MTENIEKAATWHMTLAARATDGVGALEETLTSLVDRFRSWFPTEFAYEGNRATVFDESENVSEELLAHCIEAALTYHRR